MRLVITHGARIAHFPTVELLDDDLIGELRPLDREWYTPSWSSQWESYRRFYSESKGMLMAIHWIRFDRANAGGNDDDGRRYHHDVNSDDCSPLKCSLTNLMYENKNNILVIMKEIYKVVFLLP